MGACDEVFGVSLGETASSADLGGISKYSNENFTHPVGALRKYLQGSNARKTDKYCYPDRDNKLHFFNNNLTKSPSECAPIDISAIPMHRAGSRGPVRHQTKSAKQTHARLNFEHCF